MREIEFRGITVNEGEFIYSMTISFGTIKRKRYDIFIEVGDNKWKGVKKETVGQYTGLKDKNGVKIFEGDIVKFENEECETIVWANEICCFESKDSDGYGLQLQEKQSHLYEVIGNIHENKELLEKS